MRCSATTRWAVAVSFVLAISVWGTAAHADVTQGIGASVDPSKAGRAGKVRIELTTGDTLGNMPPRPVSELIRLPRGARVDVRGADTCRARRLREGRRCPKKSRVGSGAVVLDIRAGGFESLTGPVVAYNAKPIKSGDEARLLLEVTETQTQTRAVIEGRVVKEASGAFGYSLRFDSVPAVQTAGGLAAHLVSLDLSLQSSRTERVKRRGGGTRKRKYNYYRNPSFCSSSRRWYFGAEITLEGGQPLVVSVPVRCKT